MESSPTSSTFVLRMLAFGRVTGVFAGVLLFQNFAFTEHVSEGVSYLSAKKSRRGQ